MGNLYDKMDDIPNTNAFRPALDNPVRGDGGKTNYYALPPNATELKDLIRHKNMLHGVGEAFCALYRLNDNGEYLRNLKKVIFYIQEEINHYKETNAV